MSNPKSTRTSARRAVRLLGCALATGLLASACGGGAGGGSGGSSGGDILIGVPAPLSGDYASAGTDVVHGAELAAKDINAKGGVIGRKLKIVSQDDACTAQTAAQAAQKLVAQKVVAVTGGYCSTAALPEVQAFHRVGVPYVMAGSTNPQLTEQGFAEAFRTIGRDDEQGPFVAKFVTGFLHAKRIAIGNDNTTYSKGLADSTAAALKKAGAQVVFNNALTPGQSDYSSFLTKVGQSKPDLFYYSGYFAEFGLLIKQAKRLGLSFPLMGGDANNDTTLIKTAGKTAEGVYVDTAPLAQFLDSAKGYVDEYKQTYKTGPGPYSTYAYDGVGVIAAAIKKAKSADAKKITSALHSLGTYKGITGEFSFDKKGDRKPVNYIIVRVENGEFTAYKKFDATTQKWTDVA
jgi:branched-chain amino acid transport system substrate-binding protein